MGTSGFCTTVGITLAWVILAPGWAVAEQVEVTVTGQVTLLDADGETTTPPTPLTLYLVEADLGGEQVWRSETNQSGAFHFEGVPPAWYRLQIISGGATIPHEEPDTIEVSVTEHTVDIVLQLVEGNMTVVAREQITGGSDLGQPGWQFGAGLGLASLDTGGFSYRVPAITLFVSNNEKLYINALVGGRPVLGVFSTTSADRLYTGDTGDRRENIAALHTSYYPTQSWWGGAFGYQVAWAVVPVFDEFVTRAAGFTLGGRARVRWPPQRIQTVFGLDFQSSNLSVFGEPDERTFVAGLALSVTFNFRIT